MTTKPLTPKERTPVMDALIDDGTNWLRSAYLMGRASYCYSRSHGLTIIESLVGSIECAWSETNRLKGE